MSTDLMTYLNYMANWENESDKNIQTVIDEQKLFTDLGDFKSDDAVSEEFSHLMRLAKEVRDLSISAGGAQIAADAAAVAAFRSFGFGMIAFVSLEAIEAFLKYKISSESKELNKKLTTVDSDVAAKINEKVYDYIDAYKKNNRFISTQAPKGIDTRHARANLMQFMAQVDRFFKEKGGLTVDNFRRLSRSARIALNSPQIQKVYDALDELNLGDKTDADIKKFAGKLSEFSPESRIVVQLVEFLSFGIAEWRFRVSRKILNKEAEALGMEKATSMEALEAMDAVGKFALGIQIAMSVIDVVLEVYAMADIVEKCKAMCHRLHDIEKKYKDFFNGIKDSAKAYN